MKIDAFWSMLDDFGSLLVACWLQAKDVLPCSIPNWMANLAESLGVHLFD